MCIRDRGMFGGLTVIFFLPPMVSIIHGTLAQTFLVILIIIAYGLSLERSERNGKIKFSSQIQARAFVLGILIYIQLILGALVRHTSSGLAIPDFPTMGGGIFPIFNDAMLNHLNNYLFHIDKDLVSLFQVLIHFFHRIGALIISISFSIFFFNSPILPLKILFIFSTFSSYSCLIPLSSQGPRHMPISL